MQESSDADTITNPNRQRVLNQEAIEKEIFETRWPPLPRHRLDKKKRRPLFASRIKQSDRISKYYYQGK